MSGIFGILSQDGTANTTAEIEAMSARLERRGPDGTHHWRDGSIALGHTLLATTPEALVEVLPLTEPCSGCTITADARLDNREQLIPALGLANESRTIGDGELILGAYLKWGDDCPKHLLGDFAFAIWDPRSKRLFCARDHLGIRQFNYHHAPGSLFVFASEAEAAVAHSLVPNQLDEGRIADALENMEGIDFTSSFYDKVKQLAPAHFLTVSAALEVAITRYWTLKAPPLLRLKSDEAYAEAFLKIFTESVRSRLRSAGPLGSMLSGGMDSGSVTSIAAELLERQGNGALTTFSAVGPNPDNCIETRTILAAAEEIGGIDPHFVNYAHLQPYHRDLLRLWKDSHSFDSHMTLIRALYVAANRQGLKVVLDGANGDVVLSAGNAVARLLRRGHLRQAWREARDEERFWGPSWVAYRVFLRATWTTFAPRPLRLVRRMIADGYRRKFKRQGGLVTPEYASRVDIRARRKRYANLISDRRQAETLRRTEVLQHPHSAAANERYDRVASALAIERRDPFLDIRLVSFCLSLPPSQLQAKGWPKIVLRHALQGKLPNSVLWRPGKEHLGWNFTQALFASWDGWLNEFEREAAEAPSCVAVPIWINEQTAENTELKIKLLSFFRWIRHR